MKNTILALSTAIVTSLCSSHAAESPKPLKVLLVLGGCCHDYQKQQFILSDGLAARINAEFVIEYSPITTTKPEFGIYKNADWAKGYDVVIHDECAADINDAATIDNILNAHKNGIPAVNLHCAMHSYRSGEYKKPMAPSAAEAKWFDMLGLQSCSHGAQMPITVEYTDPQHPITKGLQNWVTDNEELYNNVHGIEGNFKTWPSAHALATGKQEQGDKPGSNYTVIAWTNNYGPKQTRIFSTTLAHNNGTIGDARYLDLVARGLLWTVGKLDDNGQPLPGYASKRAK